MTGSQVSYTYQFISGLMSEGAVVGGNLLGGSHSMPGLEGHICICSSQVPGGRQLSFTVSFHCAVSVMESVSYGLNQLETMAQIMFSSFELQVVGILSL